MRRVDSEGELAGVLWSGGGVLGHRSGESANERREKKEGVLLVLMRVKGESDDL